MSDEEDLSFRYDLATLLQEREDHLQLIKVLKTQLLQAGITPFIPQTKSTPDLSKTKRFSLPSYGTKTSESESVLTKRQTSCVEKFEIKKQSLSTYDKRSGTNDLGKQYEYVMCAFYAVRFATSDHVIDFEMTTNDEIYGDFDDIALKVRYIDGSTHRYLLQLKHTENKKGLSEKILAAEKKDFSLMKYLRTFQNLTQKNQVSCILFTNRTAYFREGSQFSLNNFEVFVKEHGGVEYEELLDTNQTPKKSVFQFGTTEDEGTDEIKDFLNQFYLFANQKNVSKMKNLITEMLKELLQCDVYDSFIHFMKSWWCGNFVLTKHDVIAKLAELVLSPSIINLTSHKSNDKTRLLETAILKFDMTLVNDFDSEVSQIWVKSEEIRQVSLTALKYGLINSGISDFDGLTPEQKSKVLWYLNKVPLIVKVRDNKKEQIKCAIKLLEELESKKKLVLLGDFNKSDFRRWRVFDNLVDLVKDDLYGEVVRSFEVSLQGRTPIPLQTLINTPEKAEIITVKELVLMSQDSFLIGDRKLDLPESYIPRTVTTTFLDTEKVLLHCINSKEVVIVNENSTFRSFLKTKNIPWMELSDYERESDFWVLLSSKCSKTEFHNICTKNLKRRVHLLQVLDDKCSILVLSSDNTLTSVDLEHQRGPIPEYQIHSVFDNPINVLCAQPGIGKSTMIKFLDNNCPPDCWSVRVNLRKFNSLLKEEPEEEEILLHFLELDGAVTKTLLEEVKMLFFENRKIYLFLDGLDEIESNCVDFALDYVDYIASTGVHVWISSRQNLEEVITTHLNVFPIDIQELNQEEQTKYIHHRLLGRYTDDEIEQISKEIFHSSDVANSHNMLGIPLQLYIITENFLDDEELYDKLNDEIFVLTKMYKNFFDGKKKHLYEKVGIQYEQQLGFNFNSYLENYEIPALRCCVDDNTFQRLNLDTDSKSVEFLEMIKNEGDKFGIINQVNEDRAVFTHQTYAEYFACLWLKKNFAKARILKDDFKSEKFQNLRLIFDIMLAENCPLHLAVIYGNSEQVKKHLPNIASRDEGGRSALHLICSYGSKYTPLVLEPSLLCNRLYHDENQFNGETVKYEEIFTTLSQSDPFEVDQVFKWSSLDYAFHFQCLYPIEKFLEQYGDKIKVDLLLANLNSVSVVYYSSKLGYPRLLEAVIDRNPSVIHFKIGEDKLSFLHVAVKGDNEELDAQLTTQTDENKIKIIKILIENGIDINVKDKNGATALHWAVTQGRYDIVKALLDEGSEINATSAREETVIHYSLQKWKEQVRFFKVDKSVNCDMTTTDRDGVTLLHWACKESDYDLTKTLLESGVDVNVTTRNRETALHYAVRSWKPNLQIIKLLIDSGIDVNQSDSFGISALHWAFDKGHYDVIGILHQKGANVTTITSEHKSILRNFYKPLKPNMTVVEMLMDYGFNVNSRNNNGTSILHWVSEKGHLGVVKLLIANGANINSTTKKKETILHYASRGWNTKLIEMYTEIGVDVNSKDIKGTTALHSAAERGHLSMVKVLLDQGANLSATTNHGETALTFAVKSREPNLEVIKLLIQKGVDVHSRDQDGVSALHWACERGHCHVVNLLLENGAWVNSLTKKGETPLHYTTANPEMVKLLLEHGVEVNATDIDGMTALHWASERGQFDLVKTLLQFGADVNSTTSEDETVLIYAVKQRKVNIEVVKVLVKSGANVATVDKNGMNALHWASESGHYDVVKILIEKGVDVNSSTKKKETVLHYASKSWKPNTEVIKRLVLAGANVNATDKSATTPLHWASKEGHYTNVEILVDLGANVLAETATKETTLHYASKAWKLNDSVLELLVNKGVDVNSVDNEGKTPLHCATEKGFYDNVKLLLEKGALVDAVTNTNLTALHFAVYGGHVRIIKLLIEKGLNISKVEVRNVTLPLYFAVRNGNLKEELLVMMAATIHEKFPLLSWKRYSHQEVTTYLQEAQPYMESVPYVRNASTTTSEQPRLFHSLQDIVVENLENSMVWFRNLFNAMICRKVTTEPRTPTFIVHYPVFPNHVTHLRVPKTPTTDRSYSF